MYACSHYTIHQADGPQREWADELSCLLPVVWSHEPIPIARETKASVHPPCEETDQSGWSTR